MSSGGANQAVSNAAQYDLMDMGGQSSKDSDAEENWRALLFAGGNTFNGHQKVPDALNGTGIEGLADKLSPQVLAEMAVLEAISQLAAKASNPSDFNQLVEALVGKPVEQLNSAEQQAVETLRKKLASGSLSPEVRVATPGQTELPKTELPSGVSGAFVSGESRGEGSEDGTIILDASAPDLRQVAQEEVVEAVADLAKRLGIPVASGDAGARGVTSLNGESVTKEGNSYAFESKFGDTVEVLLDGKRVQAAARFTDNFISTTNNNQLLQRVNENRDRINNIYGATALRGGRQDSIEQQIYDLIVFPACKPSNILARVIWPCGSVVDRSQLFNSRKLLLSNLND